MHPGWADTPGLAASLPGFRARLGSQLRTPAEGVDTLLWLAAAPRDQVASGRLYLDRRVRPFDRLPSTRLSLRDRRELWDRVVSLTGEGAGHVVAGWAHGEPATAGGAGHAAPEVAA
jgi:hypothetical protein